ncbi:enoyl-CoA hydratase/isomerase family protein [Pseudenhygromyxa sp. WMMC2535]|uniref:enoyl-CoA hydratase/isomerase family protein n=1 Tax=Pseudenhygromyxa sp. WMMC2535 TaxID=2712867 RepID=UPI0015580412|nr:enoyl-CoA hydratase/isomerase family protein [Pseudenhygromyxa sp. WMMC2535]NVB37077.1 enoyl-CoA hydratase/isomerase family protein [Pseudenhygromyxa sp. WMMC2535]
MTLDDLAPLHPRLDAERQLLVLELDHGKANEMGSEQLAAFERLCAYIEDPAREQAITCLCTTSRRRSARGKALFIAGANVTERVGWDDTRVKAHVIRQRQLMQRLRRLPIFNVAVSAGVTLGWGAEYMLTTDYSLAADEARFALPETGLGIIPGARGTAELASLVGPAQALRLGCVGEQIDADEALRIGLVQERVADVDAGLARVEAMAEQLRRRSPLAIAAFKHALLEGLGRAEAERLALEAAAYERCVDSGEAAIGRASFAEIREGKTPAWGRHRG